MAWLVPRDGPERVRADLRTSRTNRFGPGVSRRGAMADRHDRTRLGRRLVPPRLFRRWNTARVCPERGVQARFADAVVVRALRRSATTSGRARAERRARAPCTPRRADRVAADATIRSHDARPGL